MFKPLLISLALCSCATVKPSGVHEDFAARPATVTTDFDKLFTGMTLRLDFEHTKEHPDPAFAATLGVGQQRPDGDSIRNWKLRAEREWPGSRTQLIDPSNFGKYFVEVRDHKTRTLLFSRGFCSIYGEWETTAEAKTASNSYAECVRFPEPRKPFDLDILKRSEDGGFQSIAAGYFDATANVDRRPIETRGEIVTLFENGDAAHHVDLLIAGDGYSKEQRDKFVGDAKRLVEVLFDTEPYRRRKSDFNVRVLFLPTPMNTSGIGNPRAGISRDTNFGLSYNAFGSDRYVLAMHDTELREICAQSPYDAVILVFNERKYGGGGIYNLWATVAADTEPAPYVFVHEFGHSFAGLADEYYSSQVAYEDFIKPGCEPWEPNVTALLDPAKLKWKDLVAAGTPLPTPWGQKEFDEIDLAYQKRRAEMLEAKASEAEVEALFREVKSTTGPLLAKEKFAGKVGAFEGASYQAKGLYRPEPDCIMFTRNPTRFCKVCERAIDRTIDTFVR
ncbi:MAG TPA: M64 family metallopeptidase [Planctomycetota bacterium]|nr:M64 family metallopeptidase [Planctomycetota bacterium]